MKKIRWYDWAIYKLCYSRWEPILKERPEMVRLFHQYTGQWLEKNATPTDISHKKES